MIPRYPVVLTQPIRWSIICLPILVGLICLAPLTGIPAALAQEGAAYVSLVRILDEDNTGVLYPVGLAFSPGANSLLVLETATATQSASLVADMTSITLVGDRVDTIAIPAAVADPINMAFDTHRNQLLLFDAATNELIVIRAGTDGTLAPETLARFPAQHLGLLAPQGMAIDARNGHLFFLDSTGPRLVLFEPESDGRLDKGNVSIVDLQPLGLVDPRGLALDPTTGHLHLLHRAEQTLYELTQTGQVVATRDLSPFDLDQVQGIAFAPSGDLTDDPSQMHLYLAARDLDGEQESEINEPENSPAEPAKVQIHLPLVGNGPEGLGGTWAVRKSGKILEFSFVEPVQPAVFAAAFTSSLVQTINAWQWSPPSPDSSGITYLPATDRLLVSDSEVNEMSIFTGDNLYESTRTGQLRATFRTTAFSDEPTGLSVNPANGHLFISDDTGKKSIYILNPGPDGRYNTSDDVVTSFLTSNFGSNDPEGVTYATGLNVLFIADGINNEVYRVSPGSNGIFDGVPPTGDDQVSSFDTAILGLEDPEGIAYNPDTGNLYLAGKTRTIGRRNFDTILEVATTGALVEIIDVSSANAFRLSGLAYAPSSNNPSVKSLYIVDRGIDNNTDPNENDGKVYEMRVPSIATNSPPVANPDSASTTAGTAVTINVAANDTDPDGNLVPSSASTNCMGCASPTKGTLTNNGNGSFVYTPNAGFTGSDSFIYEICDSAGACAKASVSITVTSVAPDLIFADDFESGNLSAWSASKIDGGDLSVTVAAAMVGSRGLQAVINDNVAIYVTDDRPNAESHYRVKFYFDPNSIPMVSGDNHHILYAYAGTSTIVLKVQFRFYKAAYQLRTAVLADGSSWINGAWVNISDSPHAIEFDWRAATAVAANNGTLTLWIDGNQQDALTGVDNDTRRIDRVRLGAVAGMDNGTRGTYFFDAFESRR